MTTSNAADAAGASSGSGGVPLIRIANPSELLSAVPYLLGFHPEQSLVVIGLRSGLVAVTMRVDLVDASGDTLRQLVSVAQRGGVDSVVVVCYLDPDSDGLDEHTCAQVRDSFTDAGIDVGDLIEATGRHWRVAGDDAWTIRPNGDRGAVCAQAVFAGMVALESRADVEAQLAPCPDHVRLRAVASIERCEDESMRAVLDGGGRRRRLALRRSVVSAATRCDREPAAPYPGVGRSARLAVALSDPEVLEHVWAEIEAGRLDGRHLWRWLARSMPSPYDAAPLFLTAWIAWREGNAVLATFAVRRCLAGDPGLRAAHALSELLTSGVDPFSVTRPA